MQSWNKKNLETSVAVDCIALNYWGKHKRKMVIRGKTHRKATSSNRAPSARSFYWYRVTLLLYRDKWITIIRLWWPSQWLVTRGHHLAMTIYLYMRRHFQAATLINEIISIKNKSQHIISYSKIQNAINMWWIKQLLRNWEIPFYKSKATPCHL